MKLCRLLGCKQWHSAFIGLGANLDQPIEQLRQGVAHLEQVDAIRIIKRSSIYSNPAVTLSGDDGQDDYYNAVIEIKTHLSPEALLAVLMQVEADLGRVRTTRWAARELDLDLLDYQAAIRSTKTLTIPHPEIANRRFVLEPWFEISPTHCLANDEKIADLLDNCQEHIMQKVAEL